jgi:hypothetical protein
MSNKKVVEELVDELIEAVNHLIEQFPESDLGYPTAMVDYYGEWVEGHIEEHVAFAIDQVRDKIAELEKARGAN